VNLAENLERAARARGRSAAVTVDDRISTFGDLDRESRQVAGFLAGRGLRPGDRVGLAVPDVPEFAAIYYGILRLGAVAVPMNPSLVASELRRQLDDSGVRTLMAWWTTRPEAELAARSSGVETVLVEAGSLGALADATRIQDVAPRAASDTAVITFTSGTTGDPRAVELSHGNLVRNCEVVVNDLVQLTSQDVVLGGLPLFHCFGQTLGLNAAVRAGACLALLTEFSGEAALRALHEQGVTVMQGLPGLYAAMLRVPRPPGQDFSMLRIGVSGGAAMPVGVLLGFEDAFGCLVLEGYGLSESSPLASFNRRDHRRVGSVGLPVQGVEVRVVDEAATDVADGEPGEILLRGHNVMKGYWGRPDDTAMTVVRGWLHTGDVGVRDDDGFLHILGRKTEVITRGDLRFYPREVEDVLREHPDVLEAAVLVLPHQTLVEQVRAVVTVRPSATVGGAELRDFLKSRLAAHKCPQSVDVVEELPTTTTGEILKRAIRLETRA